MKRLLVLGILLLSSTAFADRSVADIIGKIAKVRIDVLDGHKQVFITDEADVAAVLAAIGTKQSPKNPTGNFSFDMSLNFFDAEDKVHSMIGFTGDIGSKNHLVTLAFSSHDEGTVKLADTAALKKIVARYLKPKDE